MKNWGILFFILSNIASFVWGNDAIIAEIYDASRTDIEAADAVARSYLPESGTAAVLSTADQRAILRTIAELHEVSFRLADAQQYYLRAYNISREIGAADFDSLFRSAVLLVDLGLFDDSRLQAEVILHNAEEQTLRYDTLLLLAQINMATGNLASAQQQLETLSTQQLSEVLLLLLYEIAMRRDDHERIDQLRTQLEYHYPGSLPYYVSQRRELGSRVTLLPTPSRVLLISESGDLAAGHALAQVVPTPPPASPVLPALSAAAAALSSDVPSLYDSAVPSAIQAGSFRILKNGTQMHQRLTALGLANRLRTVEFDDGLRYQVLIDLDQTMLPSTIRQESQRILTFLKEHNIDSFLLFE